MTPWQKAQEYERQWWESHGWAGEREHWHAAYRECWGQPVDLRGLSVIDIGGGPASMLLDMQGPAKATVLDPMPVPGDVLQQYRRRGITLWQTKAEELAALPSPPQFDVGLLYNVMQHTEHPQAILQAIPKVCRRLYFWEWLYREKNVGHLHTFAPEDFALLWRAMKGGWFKVADEAERLNFRPGWCIYGVLEFA